MTPFPAEASCRARGVVPAAGVGGEALDQARQEAGLTRGPPYRRHFELGGIWRPLEVEAF